MPIYIYIDTIVTQNFNKIQQIKKFFFFFMNSDFKISNIQFNIIAKTILRFYKATRTNLATYNIFYIGNFSCNCYQTSTVESVFTLKTNINKSLQLFAFEYLLCSSPNNTMNGKICKF